MSDVVVEPEGGGRFTVRVRDGESETTHQVTVPPSFLAELGIPDADHEQVVRESFSFLLEREPATSIMGEFELPVITRYFEDYPDEIRRRAQGSTA